MVPAWPVAALGACPPRRGSWPQRVAPSRRAGRNRYIGILKKLAKEYRDKPYSYLWVQGGTHPGLESNLGVGGFGYPGARNLRQHLASRASFEARPAALLAFGRLSG
jgi:hypothetical protein